LGTTPLGMRRMALLRTRRLIGATPLALRGLASLRGLLGMRLTLLEVRVNLLRIRLNLLRVRRVREVGVRRVRKVGVLCIRRLNPKLNAILLRRIGGLFCVIYKNRQVLSR